MKSMLGKKFKILSKRIGMGDSAIIALPSQDGSLNAGDFLTGSKYAKRKKWEDGNWYFPKTVVTKIQPKTTPKNSKVFLKICIILHIYTYYLLHIVGVSATKELSAEKIPADELQVISETKEHIDEDLPGTVLENVENAKA